MYSYIHRVTPECSAGERYNNLTPSLSWCDFKTTNKSAKFENPWLFLSSFSHWHMEGLSSKHIDLKVGVTGAEKYTVCIFQPWNFTGRGSEGVNQTTATKINVILLLTLLGWYVTVTKCVSVARCRAYVRCSAWTLEGLIVVFHCRRHMCGIPPDNKTNR